MFGKEPQLNPLESRKRLLIAESEINRVRMQKDWEAMTEGIRSLADRAKSFGAIASSAAVLVAGVAAVRRNKSKDADAKPSWLQTMLNGASLVSAFWLAFRSQRRNQKKEFTDE